MKRRSGLHNADIIRRILVFKNGGAGELGGGGGGNGGSNPPIQAKNEKIKVAFWEGFPQTPLKVGASGARL